MTCSLLLLHSCNSFSLFSLLQQFLPTHYSENLSRRRRFLVTASKTKKKKKVIVISGPIDFGKSRLTLELAKRLNGEIVARERRVRNCCKNEGARENMSYPNIITFFFFFVFNAITRNRRRELNKCEGSRNNE